MDANGGFEMKDQSASAKLKRLCTEQPFVPIGCLATVGFLVNGLNQMRKGNSRNSQLMMRGRVLAQGFTVLCIYFGVAAANKAKEPKSIEDLGRRVA
mmetsp:Transcript_3758/g.5833  ORF Transcript_3758/g.5833 Transcript_3758/m.5833 type:complete len:97 (+) Transcript_3758:130-420(+)|eukprot:CAMPEP_0185023504 /NCGR_PEP_ID=MMETSP1103-20130426/6171_1 /TAXON_ID=36769 /ORGANISM="Paraphysomonas bandaiensis, Strain Caron Lab Isolate" /LENGTH=96 /DNA_ID=CAMNT_0027556123 /DNA_START=122 /DNA_END=412 /DNA_ORIENTATION=+